MYLVFWFGKFTTRSTSLSWISLQRNNNSESWKILTLKTIIWRQRLEMHRNQHISGFLFCHFFNQELICFCKKFRTVNFDHVIVWWGCTQITGTSYGILTNNEDIPWGMRADEVDIPWGRRAPIRWTHNGTCAHIKGTYHNRYLTKEQSVRRFRAAWFLEDFVQKGKSFRI